MFVRTSLNERLTVIAVDPEVNGLNNEVYDVLFVGTSNGRVLKVYDNGIEPVLVEAMRIFPENTAVTNLLVARLENDEAKLVVIADHEVAGVPLSRCSLAASCFECVALRDPYCAWDALNAVCTEHAKIPDKDFLRQKLDTGISEECVIGESLF